jgi:hypothetical protein
MKGVDMYDNHKEQFVIGDVDFNIGACGHRLYGCE